MRSLLGQEHDLPFLMEARRPQVRPPVVGGLSFVGLERKTGSSWNNKNRRMATYLCSQEGTAHRAYPRLYPENSSRKP